MLDVRLARWISAQMSIDFWIDPAAKSNYHVINYHVHIRPPAGVLCSPTLQIVLDWYPRLRGTWGSGKPRTKGSTQDGTIMANRVPQAQSQAT
jgi:hypothetical protein